MPLGERLLRAVERHLMPWYDRKAVARQIEQADRAVAAEVAKGAHTEEIRQRSITARIDAEQVRKSYALASKRLGR